MKWFSVGFCCVGSDSMCRGAAACSTMIQKTKNITSLLLNLRSAVVI